MKSYEPDSIDATWTADCDCTAQPWCQPHEHAEQTVECEPHGHERLLPAAAERLARNGWNHTNYDGCFDAFPSEEDAADIRADVECDACQAILAFYRALRPAHPAVAEAGRVADRLREFVEALDISEDIAVQALADIAALDPLWPSP